MFRYFPQSMGAASSEAGAEHHDNLIMLLHFIAFVIPMKAGRKRSPRWTLPR
jgi:hypothetical protein